MNLKQQVLVRVIHSFEISGFMDWHARVLLELTPFPQPIRDIARKVDLFHYQVQGVLQDLLALQLIEYTREGVQIIDDWEMLLQLVSCCENDAYRNVRDWEAAFGMVAPKVVALKKK